MNERIMNKKNVDGNTSLMIAVKKGKLEPVEEIGKLDLADWNTKDKMGKGLEDVAKNFGYSGILKYMKLLDQEKGKKGLKEKFTMEMEKLKHAHKAEIEVLVIKNKSKFETMAKKNKDTLEKLKAEHKRSAEAEAIHQEVTMKKLKLSHKAEMEALTKRYSDSE